MAIAFVLKRFAAKAPCVKIKGDFILLLELLIGHRGADGAEIKQAYKKGCLRYHPDKQSAGSEEQRAVAKAMFARLADAHETLADAGKRRVYDFTLPRAGARRAGADSFTPGWGRRSSV